MIIVKAFDEAVLFDNMMFDSTAFNFLLAVSGKVIQDWHGLGAEKIKNKSQLASSKNIAFAESQGAGFYNFL